MTFSENQNFPYVTQISNTDYVVAEETTITMSAISNFLVGDVVTATYNNFQGIIFEKPSNSVLKVARISSTVASLGGTNSLSYGSTIETMSAVSSTYGASTRSLSELVDRTRWLKEKSAIIDENETIAGSWTFSLINSATINEGKIVNLQATTATINNQSTTTATIVNLHSTSFINTNASIGYATIATLSANQYKVNNDSVFFPKMVDNIYIIGNKFNKLSGFSNADMCITSISTLASISTNNAKLIYIENGVYTQKTNWVNLFPITLSNVKYTHIKLKAMQSANYSDPSPQTGTQEHWHIIDLTIDWVNKIVSGFAQINVDINQTRQGEFYYGTSNIGIPSFAENAGLQTIDPVNVNSSINNNADAIFNYGPRLLLEVSGSNKIIHGLPLFMYDPSTGTNWVTVNYHLQNIF